MKDDILSSVIFEIYKNFAMFEISVEDGMSELVFFIPFQNGDFFCCFSTSVINMNRHNSQAVKHYGC